MDQVIIEVYSQLRQAHACSADGIVETPELRTEFLMRCREVLGALPERELLHRLLNLRRKSRLPSRQAPDLVAEQGQQ